MKEGMLDIQLTEGMRDIQLTEGMHKITLKSSIRNVGFPLGGRRGENIAFFRRIYRNFFHGNI